ncbi:hypothetical protein [Roseivivax isoporae]|uniref:Uncharacterized protein n=1 Tax=Roseivivax isoporae LMG 25204 TaxID=1449351 RepID=X7F4V1_9RHOB|nr:hypothetical protein [Roseivivax isoporae]ETX27773.1 hypothetical protein RISW2_11270 [Roseivivax isoporae LMG 25204]
MVRAATVALVLALAPAPLLADEIADALTAAQEAYADGDIQYALDELDFARAKLLERKTDALGAWLPEAPEGWTREVDTDMNAGLAMMGGGVGAAASYAGPDGDSYKVTLMADNPMVASMSAMIAGASAMGMKVERIGRQRFAVQDGQMMALVGNRILVQIEGADAEAMRAVAERIDYDALATFGQ